MTMRRHLQASVVAAGMVLGVQGAHSADPDVTKIAVFDFELHDESAGGGLIEQDQIDTESLRTSTDEARRLLSESHLYSIVDTSSVASKITAAGGVQYCNGCEAELADVLEADQSMAGLFTRISRTEYTLQLVVREASSGSVLENAFTGLRMGANYSWPRAVGWLIDNEILAAKRAD